jgi:hypothetical protein
VSNANRPVPVTRTMKSGHVPLGRLDAAFSGCFEDGTAVTSRLEFALTPMRVSDTLSPKLPLYHSIPSGSCSCHLLHCAQRARLARDRVEVVDETNVQGFASQRTSLFVGCGAAVDFISCD